MPKSIIPQFTEPLLLADFLTDSYDMGGEASLLSLHSLYILMSIHGLDYPQFFEKLYALVSLQVLYSKNRARFFRLLNSFLSSTHIPSYIIAAFTKRLTRLAIRAPPHAACFVLCFVFNLVRRHPNVRCLIHRTASKEEERAEKLSRVRDASRRLAQAGTPIPTLQDSGFVLSDPYLENEGDMTKCRALESSLWEVVTLQDHYCPAVASLAKGIFQEQIKKTAPDYPVEDFLTRTYTELFEEEARIKSIERSKKRRRLALQFETPNVFTPSSAPFHMHQGEKV